MNIPAMAEADIVISEAEIKSRVRELGKLLQQDYEGKTPLLVGILRGAVVFMSDLVRAIDIPLSIDFMAVSSYGSSTKSSGVVRILKDLDEDIEGRHVLLIEDIIDTGLTLNYLLTNLASRSPASLEVCALLCKKGMQAVETDVKYVGFDIGNEFVVGYGLDMAEKYRNLPYLSKLPGSEGLAAR